MIDEFRLEGQQNLAELWLIQNLISLQTYIDVCGYCQIYLF